MKSILALVFIIAGLIPSPLPAQTISLQISGCITTADAQPLSAVKVMARGGDSSATMLTDDRGFYSLNLVFHDTRVGETPKPVPGDFILSQNYPNPFFSETVIPFSLSQPGQVVLEIFNVTGQRVQRLEQDSYPTGAHEIFWNGCNEKGRRLASGIYFYRLQTTTGVYTRKMLLLDTPRFSGPVSGKVVHSNFQKPSQGQSQITLQAIKADFDLFEEFMSIDAQTTEIQKDIVLKPMGFLPLAVGNRWTMLGITHQNKKAWEVYTISEKKLINGEEYFNFAPPSSFLPFWGWVKKNEKGDIFIRVNDTDLLFYEFSNPLIDSTRTVHIDSLSPHEPKGIDIRITLHSTEDTVKTDSIAYENCFRYFVDFWQYIGAHYHVSFAHNTGPVSQMIYSIGIEYKLNEVYLNRGLNP